MAMRLPRCAIAALVVTASDCERGRITITRSPATEPNTRKRSSCFGWKFVTGGWPGAQFSYSVLQALTVK